MSLLSVPTRPRSRFNRPLWRLSLRAGLYTGLIDAWNLNESSGNPAIGAMGNHLTDNNTVGTAAGVSAHSGTARLYASASSQQHTLANAKLGRISPGTHDFTISIWAYPTELGSARVFASVWEPGANQREWFLFWNAGSSRVNFQLSDDGSASSSLAGDVFGALSTDTWYHILCDYRASDGRYRLKINDGTADSGTHSDGIFQGSADLMVGARDNSGTPGAFHEGRLCLLGMWNRLLTGQEHTLLYNSGLGWRYPF
jgi:hypothetical protein